MGVQFYVACLRGDTPDPVHCLREHGFIEEQAKQVIGNASINQSDSIMAPVGDGQGILIERSEMSWRFWYAITGELFRTPQEAQQFAQQLEDARLKDGQEPRTWGIFEWRPRPSMAKKQ